MKKTEDNEEDSVELKKSEISDTEKYGIERIEIIRNKKIARILDVFFVVVIFYTCIGFPLAWYFSEIPENMVFKDAPWWMLIVCFTIPVAVFGGVWLMCRYPPFYFFFSKITRPLVWGGIIIGVSFQIAKLIG